MKFLIFSCALVFAMSTPLLDKFTHDVAQGFGGNFEFELNDAHFVTGSFYSLQHNKAVQRYTTVSHDFLTWFDQYFDFSEGIMYIVNGNGC